MNHFEAIKNHLNTTKPNDVSLEGHLNNLIEKYPYASFLSYLYLMELKWQDQENFLAIKDKTLKGKSYGNYINYLLTINSEVKDKKLETTDFSGSILPEPNQYIEINPIKTEIEPIKSQINLLQQIDKNEIPNLLSTLLTLYDSDKEKQKIINELIKKEQEKEERISTPIVPIDFDLNGKMSFHQWVKITEGIQKTAKQNQTKIVEIKKQEQIIDQFLEQNPKIPPAIESKIEEKEYQNKPLEYFTIMTETLAQIYIDQGKYEKATEAYQTLSLKYPEKNVYFAEQIKKIEQIKNNS
jgi:hypothetical protein